MRGLRKFDFPKLDVEGSSPFARSFVASKCFSSAPEELRGHAKRALPGVRLHQPASVCTIQAVAVRPRCQHELARGLVVSARAHATGSTLTMSADCNETSFSHLAIAALRRYAMMIGMSVLPFSSLRVLLMRLCGVSIEKGCYVGFNVAFDTCYPSSIRIGSNVTISHNVTIFTHTATPAASRLGRLYRCVKPVVVDDGAWIAAHSLLLPGVEIGRNCMVGAGSVVTASTEPDSLYAGNPARKIKSLTFPGNPS